MLQPVGTYDACRHHRAGAGRHDLSPACCPQDHNRSVGGRHGRPGPHFLPCGERSMHSAAHPACHAGQRKARLSSGRHAWPGLALPPPRNPPCPQPLIAPPCPTAPLPQVVHPAIWSIITAAFRFLLRHCGGRPAAAGGQDCRRPQGPSPPLLCPALPARPRPAPSPPPPPR